MSDVVKINSKKGIVTLSKEDIATYDLTKWMRTNSKGYGHYSFIAQQPFEKVAAHLFVEKYPSVHVKIAENVMCRPDGDVDVILRISEAIGGYYNTHPTKLVFNKSKSRVLDIETTDVNEEEKNIDSIRKSSYEDDDKSRTIGGSEKSDKEERGTEIDLINNLSDSEKDFEEDDDEKGEEEENSKDDGAEIEFLEEVKDFLEKVQDMDPEEMTENINKEDLENIKELLGLEEEEKEDVIKTIDEISSKKEECDEEGCGKDSCPKCDGELKKVNLDDFSKGKPVIIEITSSNGKLPENIDQLIKETMSEFNPAEVDDIFNKVVGK